MKIDTNVIPFEGFVLEEDILATSLGVETDIIRFKGPIRVRADISRITNAITVNLSLSGLLNINCSRCLAEFELPLKKKFQLNYLASKTEPVIDLDPQIREEIILDYPIKPLCQENCKGLCLKCGKDLNEGGCHCAAT